MAENGEKIRLKREVGTVAGWVGTLFENLKKLLKLWEFLVFGTFRNNIIARIILFFLYFIGKWIFSYNIFVIWNFERIFLLRKEFLKGILIPNFMNFDFVFAFFINYEMFFNKKEKYWQLWMQPLWSLSEQLLDLEFLYLRKVGKYTLCLQYFFIFVGFLFCTCVCLFYFHEMSIKFYFILNEIFILLLRKFFIFNENFSLLSMKFLFYFQWNFLFYFQGNFILFSMKFLFYFQGFFYFIFKEILFYKEN